MALKLSDLRLVDDLIAVCRQNQGEYLDAWHPKTSWATTYSNEFVDAIVRLYALYSSRGYSDPEAELLEALRGELVQSCRGGVMNSKSLRYLMVSYKVADRAKAL
jgi:hypothetical protein